MDYTVAQANLYISCLEKIEARKAQERLAIARAALFPGESN